MRILINESAVGRAAAIVGPTMALLSTAVLLSGCLGAAQTSSSDIGANGTCPGGCHAVTGGDGSPGSNCTGNDGQAGNGADWGGAGGQGSNGGGNGGHGSVGGNGADARGGDGAPGC